MRTQKLAGALVLVALAACAGPPARLPKKLTVVEEERPPPEPALVAQAQRRLERSGLYVGPITGLVSPSMRVALAQLQRRAHLKVTGVLDEETIRALGLAGGASRGREPERPPTEETPEPRAAEEPPHPAPLPQPPPGALSEERRRAEAILDEARSQARQLLEAPLGSLASTAARAQRAERLLASARRQAFELLLDGRAMGGYALLPRALLAQLEQALVRRALLVRGADGLLGEDDADAIRWSERSFGLPVTGRPSLRLLEALHVDPAPMFDAR